jgi:hypothetical protein
MKTNDRDHFKTLKTWERWSKKTPSYAIEAPYTPVSGSYQDSHKHHATLGDCIRKLCKSAPSFEDSASMVVQHALSNYDCDGVLRRALAKADAAVEEPSARQIELAENLVRRQILAAIRDVEDFENEVVDRLNQLFLAINKAAEKILRVEDPEPEKAENDKNESEAAKTMLTYDLDLGKFDLWDTDSRFARGW